MEILCEPCQTTFPELKIIVSQFKCGICYEFMKTPMTTSCAHTYCSICIRTWITTKQLCPTCLTEVRDESLRNNLALENCIGPYISLQNKLHELCKSGTLRNFSFTKLTESADSKDSNPVSKHHNGDIQSNSDNTSEVRQSLKPSSTSEHNRAIIRRENEPQTVNSPMKIPGLFLTSPKSKSQQKPRTDLFTSPTSSILPRVQNDGASSSTQITNSNKVPCPVCSVEIPERNINAHLDKCLTIQDNAPPPSPRTPEVQRREPLKKLVYHMMSEKDIRKKLKDFCLSTKGDRTQLVNRLQRYIVLYNSECDSANPRPVADIRKQLEKDEEALTKLAPTTAKIFRVSKTADATEIEELNKQYREENKSAFNELIRQVRERQVKKDRRGQSEQRVFPNRTTVESAEQKAMEKERDMYVSHVGSRSKRNRRNDDDSDEFSKRKVKTSKSRRIDDSDDDDLFMPTSADNSQNTPVASKTNHENTNGVLSRISPRSHNISSSSDELEILEILDTGDLRPSPILSWMSPDDNVKGTKSRPRRQRAQTELQKAQVAPVEVHRSARRKDSANAAKPDDQLQPNLRRGRVRCKAEQVRTVSRTPSLSPSRLQTIDEKNRENSETPEMDLDRNQRSCPDGEFDEDMEDGNDNLSQLVSLMNEGDSSDCTQDF